MEERRLLATINISDASVTEGGSLQFTLTVEDGVTGTIDYSTRAGTADSNEYTAVSGTLNIIATQTTLEVPTNDDADVEGSKTIYVDLSNPQGDLVIGRGTGEGVINSDDVLPSCHRALQNQPLRGASKPANFVASWNVTDPFGDRQVPGYSAGGVSADSRRAFLPSLAG